MGYEFQNWGGIIVGFEGRLESELGFEMFGICEVLCPGWIYIDFAFTSLERTKCCYSRFGVWLGYEI